MAGEEFRFHGFQQQVGVELGRERANEVDEVGDGFGAVCGPDG
jgi:hypothetical protein